jgi:hypothetical protein
MLQPRGRFKNDYDDDDEAPSSKPPAVRPSQKPASKPTNKPGAAAERRARLLAEEAEVGPRLPGSIKCPPGLSACKCMHCQVCHVSHLGWLAAGASACQWH